MSAVVEWDEDKDCGEEVTGPGVAKLLSVASSALGTPGVVPEVVVGSEVASLLQARNGFYAFESALHVFPSGWAGDELSVEEWNSALLWRDAFEGMADGLVFFAEDLFGSQFAVRDGEVVTFDPETAGVEHVADSIEEWSSLLLDDYEVLTGCPLAAEWQALHGRLLARQRLLPKMPFVAGGGFEIGNLYPLDSVEGMRFRASLAIQIRDLPDGAKIRFTIRE